MVDEFPSYVTSADEVIAALNGVCASAQFQKTPQLQRFLRFVVTRALEGDAKLIKAYTIGVEALGRSPDFDPDKDSIVRVEAVRLRKALDSYHQANADLADVRITLPIGRYMPIFERIPASDKSKASTAINGTFWSRPMRWSRDQPHRPLTRPQVLWVVLVTILIIAVLELLIDIDYPLHSSFEWIIRRFIG